MAMPARDSVPARHTYAVHRRVMYVELKTGFNDNGPATISWVEFSKTGRSVYYRGRRHGAHA